MRAPRAPTFTEVVEHPMLLAPFFAGPSWDRWKAVGKAIFAEPMSETEVALLREVAERGPPETPVSEAVVIAGRGAGKDSFASAVAIKIAVGDYRARLRPGEKGVVMLIATSKDQARIAFAYIRAAFEECPVLARMLVSVGDDFVELNNGVVIEVHTNSFRTTRGKTIICAILDECAFYRDETSANPDVELVAALRPGLARAPGSKLILISTVHRRAGLLYQRWRDCFGRDDVDVLVCKGTTLQFNPSHDAAVIEADLARDPALFGAEYLSEWRDDLSTFIDRQLLEAAVDTGVTARPAVRGVRYIAGCDPSGGTGKDSFTFSIAHRDGDLAVLDLLYERKPPLNPVEVIGEIADMMASYRCTEVVGDRYAAAFVIDAFARRGKRYVQSERDRSAIYIDALPIFAAGRMRLLDNPRLIGQLAALERRSFPTGRDRVDHGASGHDDLANAAAISLTLAANGDVGWSPEVRAGVKRTLATLGASRTDRFNTASRAELLFGRGGFNS